MKKIPIIIFAYNRPSHFKRLMIALQNYKIKNKIYLFLDGPKNEKDKINQIDILGTITRRGKFNKFYKNQIKVFTNKHNLGLAKSITKGLDRISKIHESFIVLEDDVIPYFNMIPFFTNCIKKYQSASNIGAICGYQFLNFEKNPKRIETKFLKHFIPWGWATWSKNWKDYRKANNFKDIKSCKENIPRFIINIKKKLLNKNSNKNYWSLNFMFYNYLKNNYYIFPNSSLVKNIGFDGSGTNSVVTNDLYVLERNIKKVKFNNFNLNKSELNKQDKLLKKVIKNFYN